MLKNKSMFHTKKLERKTHRSALAQQKPMLHRGFVLIWNKNRDTARFLRNWHTKTEMAPETSPKNRHRERNIVFCVPNLAKSCGM